MHSKYDVSLYFTNSLCFHVQVEVIGGADKYMAVCRSCHQLSSSTIKHYYPDGRTPERGGELTISRHLDFDHDGLSMY